MNRREKIECLLEIQEAIESFENRIAETKWSNEFGIGLELKSINDKNTDRIHTYMMCIERLKERFNKILITI